MLYPKNKKGKTELDSEDSECFEIMPVEQDAKNEEQQLLVLPTEISYMILSYLTPERLAFIANTSKAFNRITSKNYLWAPFIENFYDKNFPDLENDLGDVSYKEVFVCHSHMIKVLDRPITKSRLKVSLQFIRNPPLLLDEERVISLRVAIRQNFQADLMAYLQTLYSKSNRPTPPYITLLKDCIVYSRPEILFSILNLLGKEIEIISADFFAFVKKEVSPEVLKPFVEYLLNNPHTSDELLSLSVLAVYENRWEDEVFTDDIKNKLTTRDLVLWRNEEKGDVPIGMLKYYVDCYEEDPLCLDRFTYLLQLSEKELIQNTLLGMDDDIKKQCGDVSNSSRWLDFKKLKSPHKLFDERSIRLEAFCEQYSSTFSELVIDILNLGCPTFMSAVLSKSFGKILFYLPDSKFYCKEDSGRNSQFESDAPYFHGAEQQKMNGVFNQVSKPDSKNLITLNSPCSCPCTHGWGSSSAPDLFYYNTSIFFELCLHGNDQNTLLEMAVIQGKKNIVKLLIESDYGSDYLISFINRQLYKSSYGMIKFMDTESLSFRDREGNTLLHYGVKFGDEKIVAFLLANGADMMIYNNDGKRPKNLNTAIWVRNVFDDYCLKIMAKSLGGENQLGEEMQKLKDIVEQQGELIELQSRAIEIMQAKIAGLELDISVLQKQPSPKSPRFFPGADERPGEESQDADNSHKLQRSS